VSTGRRRRKVFTLWLGFASCCKAIKGGCGSMLLKRGGMFSKQMRQRELRHCSLPHLPPRFAGCARSSRPGGDAHTSQADVMCALVGCAPTVFRWTVSGVEPGCRKWHISRAWPRIYGLDADFGGSPRQVTAGTRQGARTITSATPLFLAPRSGSHPLRP
jgi:hypothetical protein